MIVACQRHGHPTKLLWLGKGFLVLLQVLGQRCGGFAASGRQQTTHRQQNARGLTRCVCMV